MTAPRVLVVSYAFPPLAAPESWLAAKAVHSLAHIGVEIEVVCARPRWWHARDDSLARWAGEPAAAVHVVDTPFWLPVAQPLPVLRQFPDPMRLLQGRARRLIEALDPQSFDAIITWSQWHSVHLVGLAIKRRHPDLRWLAHLSDPWVDNPLQPRHAFARVLNRRWERAALTAADVVEFTSPITMRETCARIPEISSKSFALPHVFDEDLYDGSPPRSGPIIVRHVGGFYGSRTPAPLLDALVDLDLGADELVVELVGHVPPSMLGGVQSLPPGVLSLRGPVPYQQSLRLMRESDVLVLVDAPGVESVFVPSKLIDYLGAGRPIVAITPPGAAAAIVHDARGWVADPTDAAGIADALNAAIAHVRSARGETWSVPKVTARYDPIVVGRQRHCMLFPAGFGGC